MADILLRYIGQDGKPTQEAASQILARILLPLGDGAVTLVQALLDRPTQAEVREELDAIETGDVDLRPIQQAVDSALAAAEQAQDAAAGKASLGGLIGEDAAWTIPASAVHVVVPALTASRTWSLPDAESYPRGQDLVIHDEGRFLGDGLTLTLIPLAGSGDGIPGYADDRILLGNAGASVRLRRGLLADTWGTF